MFRRARKTVSRVFVPRFVWWGGILLHPIFIFVVLQLVSIILTVVWVMWYTKQTSVSIVNRYDVAFLITGCVLTTVILLGTVVLFVYAIKQNVLNKQQRSFVSSVTHELRSPIASMQLSLETLRTHQLKPDVEQQVFGLLENDMDRLVKLVDQILVSARLDRGIKMFDQVEAFSIASAIDAAIENASNINKDLRKRIVVSCQDSLIIHTARPAVDLVFNNLLENAIKYSPPQSTISISASQNEGDVLIEFTDKGFGLDKRETKKIFKIFRRGEIAAKLAIPGTGLGLYIVRSVVKVLGGRVWAESLGRGFGSTFIVKLPIRISQ